MFDYHYHHLSLFFIAWSYHLLPLNSHTIALFFLKKLFFSPLVSVFTCGLIAFERCEVSVSAGLRHFRLRCFFSVLGEVYHVSNVITENKLDTRDLEFFNIILILKMAGVVTASRHPCFEP